MKCESLEGDVQDQSSYTVECERARCQILLQELWQCQEQEVKLQMKCESLEGDVQDQCSYTVECERVSALRCQNLEHLVSEREREILALSARVFVGQLTQAQ